MSNRGEWSSSSSLPDDIIAEILSWLPVVSILRFKSICKTWRRIIEQDDELMEKHRHRAGAATCFSYQYKHMRRLGDVFVSSRFQTEKRVEFWCIDTQKGLVLEKDRGRTDLGERLRIRNPATRQAVYLPVVAGNWTVAGMFFVGKSCCKVISFSQAGNSVMEGRFRAITVGVNAKWRPLNNNKSSSSPNYSVGIPTFLRRPRRIYGMRINYRCPKIYALSIGHVFYVVIMDTEPKKILSVDSKNERCKSGEIPETLFSNWSNVMPREWNSKLCLYSQDAENNINIWVLQNEDEWAKTSIVVDYPVPFPFIAEDAKVYIQMPGSNCWLLRGRFLINLKEDEDMDYDDDGDDGADDDDDHNDNDAVVVIKPTILQLKGMEAMPQEAIDNRPYWKEEDFVGLIPSSQIISLLSLLLST
nr:putative F-box protein At3g52320 [Ipomoea batatas]